MYKAMAYNTSIAPQAAYCSCRDDVRVTKSAGVHPIGRMLSCAHRLTYDQPAVRSPVLPFNDLHPRNPCITTHLQTLEGWKGELDWNVAYRHSPQDIIFLLQHSLCYVSWWPTKVTIKIYSYPYFDRRRQQFS